MVNVFLEFDPYSGLIFWPLLLRFWPFFVECLLCESLPSCFLIVLRTLSFTSAPSVFLDAIKQTTQFNASSSVFNSSLKTHQIRVSSENTANRKCVHVWLRCAARFQWVSTRTQNILCGLSLPHIYIIKMRWAYREVTEGTRVKSGPCQSCHLLHWPKGPDPNPIHCRGGEGEMETAGERGMVIGRKRQTDTKKESRGW